MIALSESRESGSDEFVIVSSRRKVYSYVIELLTLPSSSDTSNPMNFEIEFFLLLLGFDGIG